jgi:hypothetical protein
MPAFSFQKQFVPLVESGAKTHTIRGKRKNPPKPGEPFYGYYGMRTKQCRKLIQSTITRVQDITIEDSGRRFHEVMPIVRNMRVFGIYPRMTVDGEVLADDEMDTLAFRDGFTSLWDMMGFWDGRLPFKGDLIHWRFPA